MFRACSLSESTVQHNDCLRLFHSKGKYLIRNLPTGALQVLQTVHVLTTQSRGQQGPLHELYSVRTGQGVPLHEGATVIFLVRLRVPIFSHGALHELQFPHDETVQLTEQHLEGNFTSPRFSRS